ncbi:glycoside-pentoside-hexuronide (GPH):cation symporter [Nakamurella lactea]|uniref:glycoside-pentoside-hexuronide (GPH):cation symporter n=1 Tax=Nakamurella lactea TaxID=459515 RepID=UPI00040F576E|nr:glycoside-pentoside-hexuronide (GPH):cation symporter [Nakamurella lactea]
MTVLEVQREAAHANLKPTAVIGYGLGDFANNLAFTLGASFLLYYYTDVAGLTAASVGTMFLVVRLWDAVADLLAGRLVDRTNTRWGKFRPFILFGAVPLLFLSFLSFHVPDSSTTTKLVYAYLTYAALGLVYSLVNIPYGSLASAMTQSVHQRAKLVAARSLGAAVGGIVLTFIISPMISSLQADKDSLSPEQYLGRAQGIFTWTTLSFVVIGSLAYLLTFLWCHERVVRVQPRVTIRETFATLRSNKPLAYLCGASFFYLTGLFAVSGATLFYAQYVLGDAAWAVPMVIVNSGIQIVVTPFIPKLIGLIGKKAVFQYCGLLTVIGGVGLFLVPDGGVFLALVFLGIKGVGASLINTVMFGLEADTVEYGEWKSGQRSEGATYAIFSFTRKITQSIGGAATAWALAIGGYLAATKAIPHPVQPESALTMIKMTMGLVPAVCAIIAMLIFVKYPLTDDAYKQIRDETEARKAQLDNLVIPDQPAGLVLPATER